MLFRPIVTHFATGELSFAESGGIERSARRQKRFYTSCAGGALDEIDASGVLKSAYKYIEDKRASAQSTRNDADFEVPEGRGLELTREPTSAWPRG